MAKKYKFQIYLLLVILISYWPLSLFQYSLLNDDIDVALATKYFAGSCFQNGFLPLWNPYQIFGFPAHADLQYTNWNLEVVLIGILKGYDYITLHIIYLLYLYIGAIGMYTLGKYLSKNSLIGFNIGMIYILSGLFTAHTQSLVTILGLVWLPFVILYFFKWLDNPNLQSSILVSIFSYLFFTLGYQAFSFMILPLFASLFVLKIYKLLKNKQGSLIKNYIGWSILILIFTAILLSPVIVSQLQSKQFVARLNGLSIQDVMFNPFSPYGIISVINPLLTIGHDDLFNTDVSMRNIYIGIIPMMLLIISLFKKNKNTLEYILLFFSILFLLASFGDYTPIRKILYYVFPGFKLFRFPSLIRVIVILCLLMYLAKNLKTSVMIFFKNLIIRRGFIIGLFIVILILTLFSYFKTESFVFLDAPNLSINSIILNCSPYEVSFYFGIFQLLFLTLTYILLNKKVQFKSFYKRILLLTFIELSFTILVYGQFVAFGNIKPHLFQENFKKLTDNFPLPSKDPIADNLQKFEHVTIFWKNTGCYKKQLMPNDEWTSFLFTKYNYLNDYYPSLKDSLISYPFVYFSNTNRNEKLVNSKIDTAISSTLNSFHFKTSDVKYNYISYNPHYILIEVETTENTTLNLQQSYYSGWSSRIDNNPTPIFLNASLLMSVQLTKGKHIVEFKYENKPFVFSIILSYAFLFLLILIFLLKINLSKNTKNTLLSVYILFVVLVLIVFYLNSEKENNQTKNNFIFSGITKRSFDFNLNNKTDYRDFWNLKDKYKPNTIMYNWINFYNTPEFLHSLNYNNKNIDLLSNASGSITLNSNVNNLQVELFSEEYDAFYSNKKNMDSLNLDYNLVIESKNNPYAGDNSINTSKIKHKNIYGFVTLKSKKGTNTFVCCSIKHKNGTEEQLYFPLNKYLILDNTFQKIPYYFDIKQKINEDDEVKLFILNQTENKVYLKRFNATSY